MLVDLDALENRHCGPDEKACPDGCVPENDPTTGCALLQCAPCAPLHAKAKCGLNGECATDFCLGTWRDCNHNTSDGCEIDVAHDPRFCGECETTPCARPTHGIAGCSNKQCADRRLQSRLGELRRRRVERLRAPDLDRSGVRDLQSALSRPDELRAGRLPLTDPSLLGRPLCTLPRFAGRGSASPPSPACGRRSQVRGQTLASGSVRAGEGRGEGPDLRGRACGSGGRRTCDRGRPPRRRRATLRPCRSSSRCRYSRSP